MNAKLCDLGLTEVEEMLSSPGDDEHMTDDEHGRRENLLKPNKRQARVLSKGSYPWMSPEQLDPEGTKIKLQYKHLIDMYSFGLVVYYMYTWQYPWRPEKGKWPDKEFVKRKIVDECQRPQLPSSMNHAPFFKTLIAWCLCPNVNLPMNTSKTLDLTFRADSCWKDEILVGLSDDNLDRALEEEQEELMYFSSPSEEIEFKLVGYETLKKDVYNLKFYPVCLTTASSTTLFRRPKLRSRLVAVS